MSPPVDCCSSNNIIVFIVAVPTCCAGAIAKVPLFLQPLSRIVAFLIKIYIDRRHSRRNLSLRHCKTTAVSIADVAAGWFLFLWQEVIVCCCSHPILTPQKHCYCLSRYLTTLPTHHNVAVAASCCRLFFPHSVTS